MVEAFNTYLEIYNNTLLKVLNMELVNAITTTHTKSRKVVIDFAIGKYRRDIESRATLKEKR
jgi:hypothetical protein